MLISHRSLNYDIPNVRLDYGIQRDIERNTESLKSIVDENILYKMKKNIYKLLYLNNDINNIDDIDNINNIDSLNWIQKLQLCIFSINIMDVNNFSQLTTEYYSTFIKKSIDNAVRLGRRILNQDYNAFNRFLLKLNSIENVENFRNINFEDPENPTITFDFKIIKNGYGYNDTFQPPEKFQQYALLYIFSVLDIIINAIYYNHNPSEINIDFLMKFSEVTDYIYNKESIDENVFKKIYYTFDSFFSNELAFQNNKYIPVTFRNVYDHNNNYIIDEYFFTFSKRNIDLFLKDIMKIRDIENIIRFNIAEDKIIKEFEKERQELNQKYRKIKHKKRLKKLKMKTIKNFNILETKL